MKSWFREIITWSGLPNVITLTRLAAVPVIALTLSVWGKEAGQGLNSFVALVYLIAALSDLLDGHLARTYGHESNLGRFLDPLADKLLVASAIITLIPLGRVPAWVAFLIISRELAVTALRAIAMERNLVIAASPQGKKKTLAQNIALFCLLWNGELIWADTYAVGQVILYVALGVTYWSGWLYFRDFFRAAKASEGEVTLAVNGQAKDEPQAAEAAPEAKFEEDENLGLAADFERAKDIRPAANEESPPETRLSFDAEPAEDAARLAEAPNAKDI
jgi:CDP-diacylglycerol--glycerol-3-phosphate 3-phosphatidyltransferase